MLSPTLPERHLRLALAQINASVGDLSGNSRKIIAAIESSVASGVQLLCFPELALTGYPPEDLLLKPNFIRDTRDALAAIVACTRDLADLTIVLGFVERAEDVYDSAAIIHAGQLITTYQKQFLPNYGIFDENRYFQAGQTTALYDIAGCRVGVSVCEDIWYPTGPATQQGYAGAEVLVNISASPYHVGKWRERERMLATRASDTGSIVAYTNLVGGQDELVFDGSSCVFDERGNLLARAQAFAEDLLIVDLEVEGVFRQRLHDPRLRKARVDLAGRLDLIAVTDQRGDGSASPSSVPASSPIAPRVEPVLPDVEEIYAALVLGTRDYVVKNGFREVVIGLSGGIDSALTAAVAVDALGPEAVHGVLMPSRYSSSGSLTDAAALAESLGIATMTLPIQEPVEAVLRTLHDPLARIEPGITQENIQSRTRGIFLMALSNAYGWLVLATGNKSEMAVGYATLYGDMAGGFAVIKDVWKTTVYELARMRNARGARPVIPQSTIEKPPSAELRPNQRDTDSLPPYELLDPILRAYVEEDRGLEEIVALGYPEQDVRRVLKLVDHSEYKRHQAPPGVKVTRRAFGRDRRLPLTSGYHEWKG